MTTTDKIRITMSERRPLLIVKAEWPIIAKADWHDGQIECQANTVRKIRVRQHADGRRIVYGLQEAGNGGQYAGTRNPEGGFLVQPIPSISAWSGPIEITTPASPDEENTIRAIRRVAGIIGDAELGDECIADLPAEDLSGSDAAFAAELEEVNRGTDAAFRAEDARRAEEWRAGASARTDADVEANKVRP